VKDRHRVRVAAGVALLACLCGCLFDSGGGPDEGDLRIEGYVRDESAGPIEDVVIKAYLVYNEALAPVSTCSTLTNSNGFYRIGFDEVAEITVRPRKTGCVFRPPQISYYAPDAPLLNENFTASCGVLHSISGLVMDALEHPIVGVAVTIRDEETYWTKTVFSNQAGFYMIEGIVPEATYVVTPFLSGYTFVPPRRRYDNLVGDFENQDFMATADHAVHGSGRAISP
jgi:hypothetical protein